MAFVVVFLQKYLSISHESKLPGSLKPVRKPVGDWLHSLLIFPAKCDACSEFELRRIWHWERVGKFRHEGLTFQFCRRGELAGRTRDENTVFIKVDRCSYDGDPYNIVQASDDFSSSSLTLTTGPKSLSANQDSHESKQNAKDWLYVLDKNEAEKYFHPSPPRQKFPLVMFGATEIMSLGTTTFPPNSSPDLVDVVMAVAAVSTTRRDYGAWEANCWWLARSIRMFIETEWGVRPDHEAPDKQIPGTMLDWKPYPGNEDQVKIKHNYMTYCGMRVSVSALSGSHSPLRFMIIGRDANKM